MSGSKCGKSERLVALEVALEIIWNQYQIISWYNGQMFAWKKENMNTLNELIVIQNIREDIVEIMLNKTLYKVSLTEKSLELVGALPTKKLAQDKKAKAGQKPAKVKVPKIAASERALFALKNWRATETASQTL